MYRKKAFSPGLSTNSIWDGENLNTQCSCPERRAKSVPHIKSKTNHALRATAATRLYQAGVDEQLIMEKTGHRSLEGMSSYKRTNTEQQENISNILSLSKKPAFHHQPNVAPVLPDLNYSNTQESQQELTKFNFNGYNNISI